MKLTSLFDLLSTTTTSVTRAAKVEDALNQLRALGLSDDEQAATLDAAVKLAQAGILFLDDCGNKRCPHATDHSHACTGSNEPGQEGSAYR